MQLIKLASKLINKLKLTLTWEYCIITRAKTRQVGKTPTSNHCINPMARGQVVKAWTPTQCQILTAKGMVVIVVEQVSRTPTTNHCLIPMLRSMVVNLVILTPTSNHCINPKVRGQVVNLVILTSTSTHCKSPQVKI